MTKANKALKANLLAVWASVTEEQRFRAFTLYYEAALVYPQCIGTEPQRCRPRICYLSNLTIDKN